MKIVSSQREFQTSRAARGSETKTARSFLLGTGPPSQGATLPLRGEAIKDEAWEKQMKNGRNHAGREGKQNSPIRLPGEWTGPLVRSRTCESDVRATRTVTLFRQSERVKDENSFKSTSVSNHAGGAVVAISRPATFYTRLHPLTGAERGK
jgi:hypothetical protein